MDLSDWLAVAQFLGLPAERVPAHRRRGSEPETSPPEPAEVFLIRALARVAGRAQPQGQCITICRGILILSRTSARFI
jgi:hypothetical protein